VNDLDQAVFHADFDADAAEFALRADLQVLERVGVEVGRVRIEVREHAADRVRDQFLVFDGFDVALLDRIEYLGKGAQLLDGQAGARLLFGQRRELQAQQDAAKQPGANQPSLFQLTHLSHSLRTSYLPLIQASGSSGFP